MQLFASRSFLALVAFLGTSMVSGYTFGQGYAKPFLVKKGGIATATLNLVMPDHTDRRLEEDKLRELVPTNYTEVTAYMTKCPYDADGRRALAGSSSGSTKYATLLSAKFSPNFKGEFRSTPTITSNTTGTTVKWSLPLSQFQNGRVYSFDLRVKLGPGLDTGDVLCVNFSGDTVGEAKTEDVFISVK